MVQMTVYFFSEYELAIFAAMLGKSRPPHIYIVSGVYRRILAQIGAYRPNFIGSVWLTP
jgi:hypothetical protein